MMFRRWCCLFFFLTAFLGAQEFSVITLEEAVELALKASVDIKKNAVELGLAKTNADNLWAQLFPSINLTAGMNYNIPLLRAAPGGNPAYSASAGLSLYFNAGLPHAMKNITLAYQQKLLTAEDARRLLSLNVAKDFYSLVALEQNLLVFENAKILAEEQMERDTAAWRSGYKGELEYLQGRLSAERAALDYEKALAGYRDALAEFCAALGLDNTAIRLSGTVETGRIVPDPEKLAGEYAARRPDIAAKRHEVERAAAEEKQKRLSAKAPSLTLSANWGAAAADNFSWEGDRSLGASIRLSIPVNPWIPRTLENQALQAASAAVETASLDFEDSLEKARREIHRLCANLETLWNERRLSRLQLEIARRSYELSEEAYRSGTMSFVDFEIIRSRYTEARQGLLSGELDYRLLVLELASALNISEAELAGLSPERGE
ncbi:MAG: TolC family protein [Treponema sp.]|jgi:outer membrane protein TolC|nr:TolC family protein [Treponema sp.]